MPLDLSRVRALCLDVDGTIADTDDHLAMRLAAMLDAVPFVSGRRAERSARAGVMAAEGPVNAAYHLLDRLGWDVHLSRLRARLRTARRRGADPAHTRNLEAADEVPHEMMAGVQQMISVLAERYPMCTISTGGVPRVERFLEHYGVREHFQAVVGSDTTVRMKPFPDPVQFAAKVMGVDPQECLMVGDTTVDIRAGRAAGAQTVGVLCGFGTEAELRRAGANHILQTTSDLLALLQPAEDPLQTTANPPAPAAPDRPTP